MKKPRTDKHSSFRIYKEPYKQNEKDTLKEYIQRFLKDPEREIEIDGRVYHKVIMLEKVTIQSRGVFVLVILSTSIRAHIGDILIGEND